MPTGVEVGVNYIAESLFQSASESSCHSMKNFEEARALSPERYRC